MRQTIGPFGIHLLVYGARCFSTDSFRCSINLRATKFLQLSFKKWHHGPSCWWIKENKHGLFLWSGCHITQLISFPCISILIILSIFIIFSDSFFIHDILNQVDWLGFTTDIEAMDMLSTPKTVSRKGSRVQISTGPRQVMVALLLPRLCYICVASWVDASVAGCIAGAFYLLPLSIIKSCLRCFVWFRR